MCHFLSQKITNLLIKFILGIRFFEKYNFLNFHQIFSRNNLSVEMGFWPFYPHFICQ